MHPLLKILYALPLIIYYVIESIILSLVPKKYRYKDITGQTVLITGAGCGIGRQLALQFAKLNTRLILLDIDKKGLKETESLLYKHSNGVFLYECDVSNRDTVYATAAKIKDEVGRVDILVNNAGIVTGKNLLDCPDEKILKTFEVNVLAHFWMCKAFLPDMKSANKGHLVFVASIAGFGGAPRLTDYCASKYAVVGFEESLRMELAEEGLTGIKSTVVCPYLVNTGLFDGLHIPIFKPLTPENVASETISAVLVDQEVLVIPHFFGVCVAIKAWLPCVALRLIYEQTGIIKCMETFKGRTHQQNGAISEKTK